MSTKKILSLPIIALAVAVLLLLFGAVVVLFGGGSYFFNDTSLDSAVEASLCKNYLYGSEYDDGDKPDAVFDCGEFYKMYPPKMLQDAPVKIFDLDGNLVTDCGGLILKTDPVPHPVCNMNCGENICK